MFSALQAAANEAALPDLINAHSTFLSVAGTDSESTLTTRRLSSGTTQESWGVSWEQVRE